MAKKIIAGIDIGGTKIRTIIIGNDKILYTNQQKTPHRFRQFTAAIRDNLFLIQKRNVSRVGIGFPGLVKGKNGLSGRNLLFNQKVDFSTIVPKNILFKIDNDARCFARAEINRGVRFKKGRVLAVIFGTSVGRALVQNKKILNVKRLERSEPWEKQYQLLKKTSDQKIIPFLAEKIGNLAAIYKATTVIADGSILKSTNTFNRLAKEIEKKNKALRIFRAHFGKNAAAIGAALLIK